MRTTRQTVLLAALTFAGVACVWYRAAREPEYIDHHQEMLPPGMVAVSAPRSSRWPTVRKHYLAKHPTCAACGSRKDINVHHVVSFHTDPTKELDPTNLITLCRKHHLEIGHRCSDGRHNWGECSNPNVRADAKRMGL
jgi:5-methylcytosine-specific restriction endonuclease McrA